jgi:hypothetical protein
LRGSFRTDSFGGNLIFMRGTFRLGVGPKRLWRPLLGVVVAYAVAVQSLLIALGGFSLPAHASEGAPAIELCLHDADGAPLLPPGKADHSGCTHCVFCFAGSHHAVIGAPSAAYHRAYVEIVNAPWMAHRQRLPRLPAYAIANPRGPPLGA